MMADALQQGGAHIHWPWASRRQLFAQIEEAALSALSGQVPPQPSARRYGADGPVKRVRLGETWPHRKKPT